jgi:sugar phosphate isomerase/epimerase
MIRSKIAVQTRCLAQPFKQALHTAGRIGADGVQIDARAEITPGELSDTGLRQLRKMLNDLNLRVGSVVFSSQRGYANSQDLERRVAATIEAMRMASRLGASALVFATGQLPLVGTPERATLVDALTALAGQGSRLGVSLAAHCAEAQPSDLVELLGELPEGLMGVDLSPADAIRAGQSPSEVAAALGRHVVHMFANDAVRGLGGSAAIDVELGRGSADVPELLGALEEFDYRGWVTVERRNSPRAIEDCENAIAYLRAL